MTIILLVLFLGSCAKATGHPSVVFPRLLEERADAGVKTVRIHNHLTLSLQKASVAAKNFRVRKVVDGRTVTTFVNGDHIERSLYEDAENLATLSLNTEDGSIRLSGLIGPSHRIAPIPGSERSEDATIPHSVHKVESKNAYDKDIIGYSASSRGFTVAQALSLEPINGDLMSLCSLHGTVNRKSVQGWKKSSAEAELNGVTERSDSLPPKVVVEVFIVSDSKHNKLFSTFEDLAIYLCVCTNSVNLRYKQSRDPLVQLVLIGIERSQNEPYNVGDENNMHDDTTVELFKNHTKHHVADYGHADIVFLITGRELFTLTRGKYDRAVAGIAFLAGICTAEFVGIGEDKPGSYGVMHTYAHEVAHLIGASHDGMRPLKSMPTRPGSEECPWEDGFMMSYVDGGAKHQRLSRCSLRQMKAVLLLRGRKCWLTGAHDEYVVENSYPGEYLTKKAYCQKLFPTHKNIYPNTTYSDSAACKMKCCYDSLLFGSMTCYKVAIPDYMSCGYGKVCYVGECFSKNYIHSLP